MWIVFALVNWTHLSNFHHFIHNVSFLSYNICIELLYLIVSVGIRIALAICWTQSEIFSINDDVLFVFSIFFCYVDYSNILTKVSWDCTIIMHIYCRNFIYVMLIFVREQQLCSFCNILFVIFTQLKSHVIFQKKPQILPIDR